MGLAAERSQYLDIDGKPITEDYQGHLKYQIEQPLKESFGTLSGFLTCWDDTERKQAIIDELAEHGIDLVELQQAIPNGKEMDAFGKYGEQAKAVLDIENPTILELPLR